MLKHYLIVTAIISIITVIVFAKDKISSMGNRAKRTPESVLLALISLGGALGGVIGMYVFRHKTSFSDKFQFGIGVWFSLLLQVALGILIALLQYGIIVIGK